MEKLKKNTAIRRVKKLVLLQIGHKIRNIKTGDKKKLFLKIGLFTILSIAISAGLTFLLSFIKSYFSFTINKNLLISIILITQIISIISSLDNVTNVLYVSRENTILLAYPCKYDEIFISKIVVFSLEEIKKSLFFLLPFLIAFGIVSKAIYTYWLLLIPIWLILCILPVLISASLSIVVSFIKRFLQNHLVLYAILIIIFYIGLYALVILAKEGFENVLRSLNEDGSAHLRIIAIYGWLMKWIQDTVLVSINKFALWNNLIGEAMFGINTLLYFPIIILIFLSFGALCFLVAMPFYFKGVSSSMENSSTKKHKIRKEKKRSLFFTFLKKELTILFRTSSKLKDAINVIFLFPLIVFVMNFIISTITTNNLGNYLTIAFNLMIILSLLGTHNANSAMAISSEGSEFQILKTAPSNTMITTWAKCAVNSIVDLIAIIVLLTVLVFTTNISALDLVFMGISLFLVSLGQIFWSFEFDVRNPKINDYAVKGDAVTDNVNVARAIVMSFLVATFFGFLILILLYDSYLSGWIRYILIALGFFIARVYLYNRNLKVFFNDIQM